MKQFFKTVFASALGFVVAGTILLVIFFIGIAGVVASLESLGKQDKVVKVEDHSILHIKLDRQIVDRAANDPFSKLNVGPFKGAGQNGLESILKSIDNAAYDEDIDGVFLDLTSFRGGMGTLEEIRNELLAFKDAGKWIVAYSEGYSQAAYYLATAADEVYLNPLGEIDFKGLSAEVMFFKGMLEKLDIDVQIVRGSNNKFKSAVEPFMYEKMSDANRRQTAQLLTSVWGRMVSGVSNERAISVAELNILADSLVGNQAEEALSNNLVDGLKYRNEVIDLLKLKTDIAEEDELELVALSDYSKHKVRKEGAPKSYEIDDEIAVIYASGAIVSGESSEESMGSVTIAEALMEARNDSDVKAIVLRINSPGGSALASEVIWKETQLARAAKPFVVSMGDVAASGGYYIASGSDKIFANPTTITGSIGVFGMIPNLKGLMNNKLGLTFDGVKTNDHADFISANRALSDFEYRKLQKSVDKIYSTFLTRVSTGRNMTKAEVDAIGQGRVWTGDDALEIGLVDTLGGLDAAILYASQVAGLEHYKVKDLPKVEDPFKVLMKEFSASVKHSFIEEELGEQAKYYERIRQVKSMSGVQAFMPYFMEMH